MRKFTIACYSLFFVSLSAVAQVLSPNTEAFLLRTSTQEQLRKTPGQEVESVKAFIEITDDKAVDALKELGVTIYKQHGNLLTASIPVDVLRSLSDVEGVSYVQISSQVYPLMDEVRKETGADIVHEGLNRLKAYTGKGVVVGVIDSGFEYGHVDFYTSDGKELRVKRIWNQTSSIGRHPEGFDYGTEYSSTSEILAARMDNSQTFHGTHVTGIAAGGDKQSSYYGMAPDADIVLVSYGQQDVDLANAISYIFSYAESVGKPCVINMSLGSHYGPHDGTSIMDRFIDNVVGEGRILVGACGNESEYNLHAYEEFTENDKTLKTMLAYRNSASKRTLVDIWGSVGSNFKVKGVIVDTFKGKIVASTPEIDASAGMHEKYVFDVKETGANCYFIITSATDQVNDRPHVYIESDALQIMDNRKLGIVVTGEVGETVDMWNCTYGDFVNAGKAGWTPGDNSKTVGEVGGTARGIISVGAYNTKFSYTTINGETYALEKGELGDLAVFSSHGPTLDGRIKPDVTAPGMLVIAAANQYAIVQSQAAGKTTDASGQSFYYDVNAGTSMACPVVTGTVALWLEADATLDPDKVKTVIRQSATRDTWTGETPNNDWGEGKIHAENGIRVLLGEVSVDDIAQSADDLRVSSDPVTHKLTFFFKGRMLNVRIFDISGQVVSACQVEESGDELSTFNLASGVYLVEMECDGVRRTVKLAL